MSPKYGSDKNLNIGGAAQPRIPGYRRLFLLILIIFPLTVWCKPAHVDKCRAFEKAVKKEAKSNSLSAPLNKIEFQEPNQYINFKCVSFGSLGGKPDAYGDIRGGMSFSFSAWPKESDAENECIKEKGGFGEQISENLYQHPPEPYIDWHHYLLCNGNSMFHMYYSPKEFPTGPDPKLIELGKKFTGAQ